MLAAQVTSTGGFQVKDQNYQRRERNYYQSKLHNIEKKLNFKLDARCPKVDQLPIDCISQPKFSIPSKKYQSAKIVYFDSKRF